MQVVGFRHEVRVARVPEGGPHSGGAGGVLEADRQTVQRARLFACGELAVRLCCSRAGTILIDGDYGVDQRIEAVDLFEVGFEDLDGGHLAGTHEGGELHSPAVHQFIRHDSLSLCFCSF